MIGYFPSSKETTVVEVVSLPLPKIVGIVTRNGNFFLTLNLPTHLLKSLFFWLINIPKALVKSIIDLHHGNIDVISQVDVGSTFIVRLPSERKFIDLKDKLSLNRKD